MAIDFPDSPSNNDIYTVNGKRWIYSNGKWSIYGSTSPDATASDTEPTGVGDGHIWYRSDQSQTLIRYDNTWVEVGSAGGFDNASTSFPTSLDSATGFAAVEALQAKVGVNSSAVTSSHDYILNQPTALTLKAPLELWTISATAATGTVNVDLLSSGAHYFTADATANWTYNFRGDGSSSLDSLMVTNESVTVVHAVTNGATAYYPTAFQVDGSAVTPKWSGGSAPSSGNASSVDAYLFTVVKTASATFTVLAQQVQFA